jgi:hypothetical protein
MRGGGGGGGSRTTVATGAHDQMFIKWLFPLCLCQSLPPQPYALEVSNQVLNSLVIASRQPQRGGEARGRGGRHSSTRDTLSSSALVAGRSIPPQGAAAAGGGSSQTMTRRLSTAGRTGNVGVEYYVSFFNGYASDIYIYIHHPNSSSSSSTPLSTPFPSKVSVENSPVAAILSNSSTASAASLSSLSL